MVDLDIDYFSLCFDSGLLKPRFLEIGSAKVQGIDNLCDHARRRGIESVGVDITAMDGVDAIVDFSKPTDEFRREWALGQFGSVAIFNVLEHTFDPIQILENATTCMQSGATLLVLTPAIWPVHNYPGDYVRLLPDWYRQFAKLHDLEFVEEKFCWISKVFGIEPVGTDPNFPTFMTRRSKASMFRYWISRIGHKLLNTYGRSHWATYCSIGAVMVKR